jgi:hypothetical protein
LLPPVLLPPVLLPPVLLPPVLLPPVLLPPVLLPPVLLPPVLLPPVLLPPLLLPPVLLLDEALEPPLPPLPPPSSPLPQAEPSANNITNHPYVRFRMTPPFVRFENKRSGPARARPLIRSDFPNAYWTSMTMVFFRMGNAWSKERGRRESWNF